MFAHRLQRAPPPMAYDLESVDEDPEEEAPLGCTEDEQSSEASDDLDAISVDLLSDAPGGFELQFDRNLLATYSVPAMRQEAEMLAYTSLRLGRMTKQQLCQLFEILAAKVHNRFSESSGGSSFTAGAHVYGGVFGQHRNTWKFPWTSMLLTSVVTGSDSAHFFTSLTLSRSNVSGVHVDSHNSPDVAQLLHWRRRWVMIYIHLGRGRALPPQHGAIYFNATRPRNSCQDQTRKFSTSMS